MRCRVPPSLLRLTLLSAVALLPTVLPSAAAGSGPLVPARLPPESLPDPADLVPWPAPAYPQFASGSVVRVHDWLWDAPAGKRGWARPRPDGQLAFDDGTPAHFWGSTTVYGMTFPEKTQEVARLAEAIAASGYNLVRFHHNDMPSRGLGFLQAKPASNYKLDPESMDRLDRFAAELFKRGVYVYLDFADYRSMLEEDGLEDWEAIAKAGNIGWKGLFPHPAIVAAWKRSALEFLNHRNPYTGRTWGEEPGVATVEIINENGLFWDWSFKTPPSVQKWQDQQWNAWLLRKYGARDTLDAQWTDLAGARGLYDDEDPAKGTVFRPRLVPLLEWDRPYRSKTRGAARVNDYYAFLAESATGFYREAAAAIRGAGFQGTLIGSHELHGPINQKAEVDGAGSIAAHLYAGGNTAWNARPGSRGVTVEGVDVKTRNWFSNIPRIKVRGVPGINGEWAGGTLTRRADVNLAVASVTAFQRVAQSLHFSYGHRWTGVPLPDFDFTYNFAHHLNAIAHTFSSIHDEPWMAVNRICAPLFIRGDLARPRYKVHLAFSAEDVHEQNLHALGLSGGAGTIGDAALFLPLLHEVECFFFDTAYEGDADVVFMTGRTASGDYRKAKHAVLVGDNPYGDRWHKTRDLGAPARHVHPGARVVTLDQPVTFRVRWPWAEERELAFPSLEGAVELASIPAGAQPIGASADGRYTLGWLDDRFLVLPNGRAFGLAANDPRWLYRLYLAAAARWKISLGDNGADAAFYRSDTRELTVDWGSGTLVIDTPRTQGFSGFPGWRGTNETRDLACTVDVPYANVLVTATDGQPVPLSSRLLLVAAGRMQNSGQELGKDKNGFTAVTKVGKGPMMVEALRGRVRLRSGRAGELAVYALDHAGRRLGRVETAADEEFLSFDLSPKWGTLWFEIAASGVEGPAAPAGTWPLEEKPRTAPPPAPQWVPLDAAAPGSAPAAASGGPAAPAAEGPIRFVAREFAKGDFVGSYGNAPKPSVVDDADQGVAVKVQFGKVNQDWFGGFWTALNSPTGVKPEDCLGFAFPFKGDGTLPREAYLALKTAGGAQYRTKNLNALFENDAWREVLLKAGDFTVDAGYAKAHPEEMKTLPPHPDWQTVNRMDFNCVGPLMDQMSVAHFGNLSFVLARPLATPTVPVEEFRAALPAPAVPEAGRVAIPYKPGAAIDADGRAEPAWSNALAVAMDEDRVPAWHFYGSHVVEGKRANGEGANFWLLATEAGLAVMAEIRTGRPEVVTEGRDWWAGDCLEIFTDASNAGGTPTKQVFLAYRRPNLDRPAASGPGIRIGRLKLEAGYVLEAVIPWTALGFTGAPDQEFGLEFQLDFGSRGGTRVLQMTYGTGTNEAWTKAGHYLKVRLLPAPPPPPPPPPPKPAEPVKAAAAIPPVPPRTNRIDDAARPVGTARIAKWKDDRQSALLLMFDDSIPSQVKNVVPELAKRGFTGTFYVCPGKGEWKAMAGAWEKDIPATSMEYGNHTLTHKGVKDAANGEQEIGGCNEVILKTIPGPRPRLVSFAQPGVPREAWTISKEDLDALLAKHHLVNRPPFAGRGAGVQFKTGAEMLAYADKNAAAGGMEAIIFHGVGGDWISVPVAEFTALLDGLAAREDRGWVTGHMTAYRYAQERDGATLVTEANGKDGIRLALACTTDPALYDVPLTLVARVPEAWKQCRVGQGGKTSTVLVEKGVARFEVVPISGTIALAPAVTPPAR